MDAEVSRVKFEREVAALTEEAAGFVRRRPWEVVGTRFPVLCLVFRHSRSGRRVGFRFACDDWDQHPPSLSLSDPDTGAELGWERWPQSGWAAQGSHPVTGRPFLCLPGLLEYHTHSSHLNDSWVNYRPRRSYQLRYIVDRVWQKFEVTHG